MTEEIPADPTAPPPERFYGRRKGKALRQGQRALVAELLPRIAVPTGDAPLDPWGLFATPPARLALEIGFGGGEHLVAQAARDPDCGFLGAEPFLNGVVKALDAIRRQDLANVRLWPDDARRLLDRLPDACLGRVWVLYPDPWPKTRHHERRLVAPALLDRLARLMPPGAELRLASDHADYVAWMIRAVAAHPAFADPEVSAAPPPGWVPTRYEEKARAQGVPATYISAARSQT